MNPFRGVDFYQADDLLSDVERMARDTVREWVGERVVPVIDTHFEDGTFPMHLIPEMAELGLFGANLPEEYGCAGMNNVAYGLVMQELERGDSGIRSFASVQGALVMYPIYTFGTEEQKRHWLPLLARGEKIGCFGLTEPDHGSDPGGMTTTAIRKGDRYVLNGTKSWITNGTIADVAVVWAKLDGQVTGFLVENGTSGFTAPEIRHKMSLRASITSQLIFEDCAIPEEPLGSGGLPPLRCLNQARYGIAWEQLARQWPAITALGRSRESSLTGRSAGFSSFRRSLCMLTEITKAQLLALRLGRLKDENRIEHSQTSLAKRNNCAMALEVARMARDVLGANGISLEYPVIRHMCNLEAVKTYEGTHDIHTLILGQSITGQNAFR